MFTFLRLGTIVVCTVIQKALSRNIMIFLQLLLFELESPPLGTQHPFALIMTSTTCGLFHKST